jgi:hypothetical protein
VRCSRTRNGYAADRQDIPELLCRGGTLGSTLAFWKRTRIPALGALVLGLERFVDCINSRFDGLALR